MTPRWLRHLRHLGERVGHARAEVDLSRERLEQAHREVVEPLRRAGNRNQFAELIRDSLLEGRGGR